MRYLLAVLTHGNNADVLAQTIRSFEDSVTPAPSVRLLIQDGPCALPPLSDNLWTCQTLPHPRGFCFASRQMWKISQRLADAEGIDYVFWLEHDFCFLREVDLRDLAVVLEQEHSIAQVSLMRGTVNEEEVRAGGVLEHFKGLGGTFKEHCVQNLVWTEHSSYFTTNPSLMRVRFMQSNAWPVEEPYCEGRFGIELIERGYRFAIMGNGESWVDHIGNRNGFGY